MFAEYVINQINPQAFRQIISLPSGGELRDSTRFKTQNGKNFGKLTL